MMKEKGNIILMIMALSTHLETVISLYMSANNSIPRVCAW